MVWIQPLDTCFMERADHYPESSIILVCRCLPTGIEPEEEKEVVSSSACQKGTLPCIRPPMLLQTEDLAGLTLSVAPQGSCLLGGWGGGGKEEVERERTRGCWKEGRRSDVGQGGGSNGWGMDTCRIWK